MARSVATDQAQSPPQAPMWHRTVRLGGGLVTDANLAAWLDDQYNNRARVPQAQGYLQRWADASARARHAAEALGVDFVSDVPYGPHASETMDVFLPACGRTDGPLLVFLHGGYWRALSKGDFSFVGVHFAALGARVVVPDYALCPGTATDPVDVPRICLQAARAVAVAAGHAMASGDQNLRVLVCGHSAGGHLAAMLGTCQWARLGAWLGLALPPQLVSDVVSLSGLFELGSIARSPLLQSDLRLTEAAQRRCSPAGLPAPRHARLHAFVGALESPMYHAQHALITERWAARLGQQASLAGLHHFSIMQSCVEADSAVHRLLCERLGLGPTHGPAAF
jgi:arylformamidase